ncbi:hypothetical protein HOLleu_41545 [Holothuria leucospilota]|uniref:Uncharacterized protein n=1 Tax=Holothuria leucospilota TaxID=206669 RepID=A0A9Q1BAT0_HOLLE|nr:hypothetical protein HOLleu_41545 [Holothuria leucospilota]
MESSREFNFNAAVLELSRSENCLRVQRLLSSIIHRLALSLFARGTSSYATARYSTLQVYYRTIVNVHALPALGPDQANIN